MTTTKGIIMTSTADTPSGTAHKPSQGSTSRLLGYAEPIAAVALALLAAVGASQERWILVLVAPAASALLAGAAAILERRGRITFIRGRAIPGGLVAVLILGAWLYALAVTGIALIRWVAQ